MIDFTKLLDQDTTHQQQHIDITHPLKAIKQWTLQDTNADGTINGADIPFEPGSLEAKAAWHKIELMAYSPASIAKAKALGYENAKGMYADRPLCPGKHIMDGDSMMMRDRLIYRDGYTAETARQVLTKMFEAK